MSNPSLNLVITGRPLPRTTYHTHAGKTRVSMNQYKARNQRSSIFSGDEDQSQFKNKTSKLENDQFSVGVITKDELETIKKLTARKESNQKYHAIRSTPQKLAPPGVPQLSLDGVVEKEKDEDMLYSKIPLNPPQLESPTSKDTYSWGTPNPGLKVKHLNFQTPKGGGWQVDQSRKPKKVESPSRKRDDVPSLDLKLSQTNEGLSELKQAAREAYEDIRIEYLGERNQRKVEELRKLNHDRKVDFIDNTVLADQLGNIHVNDEKPLSSTPPFGVYQRFDSRLRRHQDIHSSAIDHSVTEVDLSKRLQFSARILSLDGHDARREISGFFFIADHTLTLYEFRQFGTRSNALPFIQKGNYHHVLGYRIGKPYTILDIDVGKNISFYTDNQPSIPDSLRKKKILLFRITEIDENMRQTLLFVNCKSPKERSDVEKHIQTYYEEEKKAVSQVLTRVRGNIRQQLKNRGAKTMTNLHNHFKQIDQSGDGMLDTNELQKALKQFRIEVDNSTFDTIWHVLDSNKDGQIDYGEFVRGLFGEMNEERKKWVRKAFNRLDCKRSGVARLVDLQKFFCPSKHPDVVKGVAKKSVILDEMLVVFQTARQKTEISYSEFEAFYEGLSMGLDSDDDFINLVRSTWTL